MKDFITTERLEIRPIIKDDCEAIHRYAGDPSIDMMMFLPNDTIEETKKFVEFAVSEWAKEEPEDMEFVVVLNGEIIGGVNLEKCGDDRTYEIGWTIRKDMRGKGYATEAAKALMYFAFDELNAVKIQAHCDSRNEASENVMKKLGMTLIDDAGTRYYPKTGISSGEYLYAISKAEDDKQKLDDLKPNQSLEELENDWWGEPEFDSYVVKTSHLARQKPINKLTDEEIRLLIGQKIGLKYLLPIAVKMIEIRPDMMITFYPGDLLKCLLSRDKEDWKDNRDDLLLFRKVVIENAERITKIEEIPDELVNRLIETNGD